MCKRNTIIVIALRLCVIALALYATSYFVLRATRVLIRTGTYTNSYGTDGLHTSGATWRDLRVSVRTGQRSFRPPPTRHTLEYIYAPLIYLECQHFYAFGVEPRRGGWPACCVRIRNVGRAAMAAYVLVSIGAGCFVWRRVTRFRKSWEGCCSRCGYDLRGLPADTCCPECGQKNEQKSSLPITTQTEPDGE